MNLGGASWAAASAMKGDFATPLAIGGGGFAASLLMSTPAYTQWMTKYIALRAAIRDGSDVSLGPVIRHINGLEKMARVNPDIWPAVYAATDEINEKRQRPTR
jgi:hypothetical protein